MKKRNIYGMVILSVLMSCLFCSAAISLILSAQYGSSQYRMLSMLADYITDKDPQSEDELLILIKNSTQNARIDESMNNSTDDSMNTILSSYGFTPAYFAGRYFVATLPFLILSVPLLLFLFYLLYLAIRNYYRLRITQLTRYLARVNASENALFFSLSEAASNPKDPSALQEQLFPADNEFSQLQDEIYKTVTSLIQTKEIAVKEHKKLSDSLADISHQLKTPVSSISLMTQLLGSEVNAIDAVQILQQMQNQTSHLEQLIETLLTLSRIDAGTLKLKKTKVDIFTLLQLSLEAVEPFLHQKNIQVTMLNHPELFFMGDLDWSVEALLNLIKNCVEHTPENGLINIEYSANPLYVQIEIRDNGPGFAKKDLPHLFERFYRGEHAANSGTGIGLALAKSIIELQNGVIHAKNYSEGAGFILRFYSH